MLFQYTLRGGAWYRIASHEYTLHKSQTTNLTPKLELAAGLSYAIKMSYRALATANPILPASISSQSQTEPEN